MISKTRPFLRLLAFFLTGTSLPAQETPTRLKGSPEELGVLGMQWYGVYWRGTKVGYHGDGIFRRKDAIGDCYVTNSEWLAKVTRGGKRYEASTKKTVWYSTEYPYPLLMAVFVETQGTYERKVRIFRVGDEFKATIREGDQNRQKTIPAPDFGLSDKLTRYVWFRQGPAVGRKLVTRSFSSGSLKSRTISIEIVAKKKAVAHGVRIRVYEVKKSNSDQGEEGGAGSRYDGKGYFISGTVDGFVEYRREPKKVAQETTFSPDIFVLGTAKIARPLGDPGKVTGLVIEVTGEGAAKFSNGPGQSATSDVQKGRTVLKIGAGQPRGIRATKEEVSEALKDTMMYPSKNGIIKALLKKAIGDAKDPRTIVARLVAFVDRYIQDSYTAEPLTVLDTVNVKKGDCSEHTDLFTTLARAAGIPCRGVAGLMYMGDDVQAFGWHAWNEVVLDGNWVPVDATWGETQINATHIRLGPQEKSTSEMMKMLGKVHFRVLEIKRSP